MFNDALVNLDDIYLNYYYLDFYYTLNGTNKVCNKILVNSQSNSTNRLLNYFYVDGTDYVVYQDKTYYWGLDAYKTITITGGEDIQNETFITWLKANATKQESIVGTWVFNDGLPLPSFAGEKIEIGFTCNGCEYNGMLIGGDGTVYYYYAYGGNIIPYDTNNGWDGEMYQKVTFTTDVISGATNKLFREWLDIAAIKDDAAAIMTSFTYEVLDSSNVTDLKGTTWRIKDTIQYYNSDTHYSVYFENLDCHIGVPNGITFPIKTLNAGTTSGGALEGTLRRGGMWYDLISVPISLSHKGEYDISDITFYTGSDGNDSNINSIGKVEIKNGGRPQTIHDVDLSYFENEFIRYFTITGGSNTTKTSILEWIKGACDLVRIIPQ